MIPILILAAGASSRMGGTDKLMIDVDGQPLLRRVVDRAASVAPTFVTLPPRPHARYDALRGAPCIHVPVSDATTGMSASLRRGIAGLPHHAEGVMILPADMPDITAQDMARVLQARHDHPQFRIWQATTADGKPGHPVLFDASLFDLFGALYGDTGGAEIIRTYADMVCHVPLEASRARCDLDTPQDWENWQKLR